MLGLYVITIYIDNLKYFSNENVSLFIILKYIQYKLPEICIHVLPASALFSTAYIFGMLNTSNEIIAIYNGRISFIRIMKPLLILGIFLSIFVFVFYEFIVTESSIRAFEIRNNIKELSGKDTHYMYSRARFFLKGANDTYYYLENYDSKTGILFRPVLFRFNDKGKLDFQLYALHGRYNSRERIWEFKNAVIIESGDGGGYREERMKEYSMKLAETPESFRKKPVSVMQMQIEDAINFIEAKKKQGGNFRKELVEFHWRFAFPFSVIIVILIGSTAGIYFRRAVLVLSFFLSILLSFGYYGLLALGIAFGKSGKLSPVFAAWSANLFYLAAGVIAVKLKR